MSNLFMKRIYESYEEMDGCRILIDRLWPRGISKDAAKLSFWFKDLAPSSELRKWFCHKPELFEEFSRRYLDELRTDEQKREYIRQIIEMEAEGSVTLLYGAKEKVHNHALVLMEELGRLIGMER
ncbi:DUF488 domain-containing protein [Neobacillus sp. BF23-41]|uniref:DUF488 domain-containing protein n=1 Tax=Neobacillus sp. BF23-41 TaxID=3240280 RepID=UPI0034E4E40B